MVSIVVLDSLDANARILLLRRAGAHLQGVWSYVAGHVEKGETGWQTACRELAEETGLTPQALYTSNFCEQFYAAVHDCVMVVPAFVARVDGSARIRLNAEHSAYRWLPLDQAMQTVPFGGQRDLFAHVQREFIEREPSKHLRIAI